jgi:putative flippase GtrA
MRLPASALTSLALLLAIGAAVAFIARQSALGGSILLGAALAGVWARAARSSIGPRERGSALGPGSFARNAVSSAVATGSDFALVALLVSGFLVSPPIATFVGCVLGGIVNFTVNRVWAFGSDAPTGPQALRYLFVTSSSAVLNSGLVFVLLLLPSVPYALAWWLVRGAVFAFWNFPLNRDYVFLRSAQRATPGA